MANPAGILRATRCSGIGDPSRDRMWGIHIVIHDDRRFHVLYRVQKKALWPSRRDDTPRVRRGRTKGRQVPCGTSSIPGDLPAREHPLDPRCRDVHRFDVAYLHSLSRKAIVMEKKNWPVRCGATRAAGRLLPVTMFLRLPIGEKHEVENNRTFQQRDWKTERVLPGVQAIPVQFSSLFVEMCDYFPLHVFLQ